MSADHADMLAYLRKVPRVGNAAADVILTLEAERDTAIRERDAACAEAEREAYTRAAQLCRDKAKHDYDVANAATRRPERAAWIAMGNRCDDCAQDIEALRDKVTLR
jgi:hypothetical protein